jgi:hypothetical protein
MPFNSIIERFGEARPWVLELAAAGIGLILGLGVMPCLIFLAGSTLLGRYDGASLRSTYVTVFDGAAAGSVASWIVILGPYALYLLFRALRAWWRAGANMA